MYHAGNNWWWLGLGYVFSNVAHKTINHPIGEVDNAVIKASKEIDFKIIDNNKSSDGRTIKAVTGKLDIYFDLEKVTSTTTRISVNAVNNIIFQDKATAIELIHQTENILSVDTASGASPTTSSLNV